jgi:dihydroorotate dehydrogenase electron transfer subunit
MALPTPLTIQAVEQDNYRTKTFVLDGAIDATPGQFVMAWLPRFDEKPFSLVDADPITLMVTAVGPFTRLLHQRRPGDTLWLRGPFGSGFRPPQGMRRAVLAGGGYGVAPLLWLVRTLPQVAITTVIGARTAADLLYVDRFAALAHQRKEPARELLLATEDGSQGFTGRVTDVLAPRLAHGQLSQIDAIFACGPHGLLAALQTLGSQHGVHCQLSWEAYMRCAIGICGACEHEGSVLCLDGPVLAYPAEQPAGLPAPGRAAAASISK